MGSGSDPRIGVASDRAPWCTDGWSFGLTAHDLFTTYRGALGRGHPGPRWRLKIQDDTLLLGPNTHIGEAHFDEWLAQRK
ncbi:hypothetical protein [Streptomyces olivaceoviridis]|uniref:hypothetical protein n=1 Tax=Streptomyces olivaceoviridis TaxID=1921 RepID=UPI0036CBED27